MSFHMKRICCVILVSTPTILPQENMLSRPIDPELTVTFDVRHLLFICRHSYHMETSVTIESASHSLERYDYRRT